jgi:hypothetical protein
MTKLTLGIDSIDLTKPGGYRIKDMGNRFMSLIGHTGREGLAGRIGAAIVRQAKINAPRKTGHLEKKISYSLHKIQSGSSKFPYVELGIVLKSDAARWAKTGKGKGIFRKAPYGWYQEFGWFVKQPESFSREGLINRVSVLGPRASTRIQQGPKKAQQRPDAEVAAFENGENVRPMKGDYVFRGHRIDKDGKTILKPTTAAYDKFHGLTGGRTHMWGRKALLDRHMPTSHMKWKKKAAKGLWRPGKKYYKKAIISVMSDIDSYTGPEIEKFIDSLGRA